jgi:hypothetical protein
MFIIELTLRNPMNGESQLITRQFDPSTMTQAKWAAAFPVAVKPAIDALVLSAQTSEPTPW